MTDRDKRMIAAVESIVKNGSSNPMLSMNAIQRGMSCDGFSGDEINAVFLYARNFPQFNEKEQSND